MRPMSGTCTLRPIVNFPGCLYLLTLLQSYLIIQSNLSNNNIFNQHLSPSVSILSGLTRHHLIQIRHRAILRGLLQWSTSHLWLTLQSSHLVLTSSDVVCTEPFSPWPRSLCCKITQVGPGVLWQSVRKGWSSHTQQTNVQEASFMTVVCKDCTHCN